MNSLKQVQLDNRGTKALFLVTKNTRDFWSDWTKKTKTKERAAVFAELVFRIQEKGIQWAINASKLKVLDGNIGLIEIKNFEGVQRVLCYMPENEPLYIIMLKNFEGHQGSDKIPPALLKQYKRLAKDAAELLEKELNNGDLT